jgi:hypothetical protein
MKIQLFHACIPAVLSLMLTCKETAAPDAPCMIQTDSDAIAPTLLTLSYAEKIMGEPAELTCNTFITKGDTLEYKCDYTAISPDQITRKTGKLYFMYEVYASVAAAENAYAFIYQANSGHQGVEIVTGVGDEAYYHSDGTNFYFYLVRKDEKMFRMKLNKVTSHSSEDSFKEVAKLIADEL